MWLLVKLIGLLSALGVQKKHITDYIPLKGLIFQTRLGPREFSIFCHTGFVLCHSCLRPEMSFASPSAPACEMKRKQPTSVTNFLISKGNHMCIRGNGNMASNFHIFLQYPTVVSGSLEYDLEVIFSLTATWRISAYKSPCKEMISGTQYYYFPLELCSTSVQGRNHIYFLTVSIFAACLAISQIVLM